MGLMSGQDGTLGLINLITGINVFKQTNKTHAREPRREGKTWEKERGVMERERENDGKRQSRADGAGAWREKGSTEREKGATDREGHTVKLHRERGNT